MSALLEVLEPTPVRIAALRNPFTFAREDRLLPAGPSIAQLLDEVGIRGAVRVWVGDVEVLPAWYSRVRPRPGSVGTIRAVARGSGRGGDIGRAVDGVRRAVGRGRMRVWGAALSPMTVPKPALT